MVRCFSSSSVTQPPHTFYSFVHLLKFLCVPVTPQQSLLQLVSPSLIPESCSNLIHSYPHKIRRCGLGFLFFSEVLWSLLFTAFVGLFLLKCYFHELCAFWVHFSCVLVRLLWYLFSGFEQMWSSLARHEINSAIHSE